MESFGSGDDLLVSVFVAMEGAFAYSAMLPSIMTIGTFVDDDAKIAAIRQGEILATFYAGAFAITVGAIMRSWLPLILTAVAAGFTVTVYEWALRRAPAWEK